MSSPFKAQLITQEELSQEDIETAKNSKGQYIGLYFSFIATTIAIFYFAICFIAIKYEVIAILSLVNSFLPNFDYLTICILIAIEISIICITSYLLEMFLESYEPIDQN